MPVMACIMCADESIYDTTELVGEAKPRAINFVHAMALDLVRFVGECD